MVVSDLLLKNEKMTVIPGSLAKIISNPDVLQGLGCWKMKANHIGQVYSKQSEVIRGSADILMHALPLKS